MCILNCLIEWREVGLRRATEGADPVGGNGVERGAGRDTVIGIALGGVVDIAADIANVLIHVYALLTDFHIHPPGEGYLLAQGLAL